MSFRFVHTADWQIGAPFGGFDNELSARLREARENIVERLGALATESGIAHIVVAGDVWDGERVTDRLIRQPLDGMAGLPDIRWWLLPGNHDPCRRNMLWDRVAARAPRNVVLLREPKPVEAEPGAWLLAAPWTSKSPGSDLTAWMDDAALPDDAIRIGVAHGSVVDFSKTADEDTEPASAALIDPARARRAGLDYLALGDWHGTLRIEDRVHYSGTPEPDRFKNNDPGNALLVEVERRAPPKVTKRRTAKFDWRLVEIACVPGSDALPELDALEGLSLLRNMLLRIVLTGQIAHADWVRTEKRLAALRERVACFETDERRLNRLVESDDLSMLQAGGLRSTAERLLLVGKDPARPEADRARAVDALRFLLSYAADGT